MKHEDVKPHSHHTPLPRAKDYMIVATVGNASRKFIWNDHEPQSLDHPQGWTIAKMGDEICIFDMSDPNEERRAADAIFITPSRGGNRVLVELPPAHNGDKKRSLDLRISLLEPIQPPYMQISADASPSHVPRQLMMYHGIRYFLLKYRPVGTRYTSHNSNGPVFTYERSATGYSVRALVSGLLIKTRGRKHPLPLGTTVLMDEKEFFSAAFVHRIYWWRFRSVISPDALPPLESDETEENARETQRFLLTSQLVVAALFLLLVGTLAYNHFFPAPPPQVVTKIELKVPKVIPHKEIAEVKPTPAPTPEIKPEPTPKKEIVKKEKPKEKPVAKKEKPKEKPKKIVKKEKPVPKPVVKKEPPPKPIAKKEPVHKKVVEPPPHKVAKREPVVAPPPPAKKNKEMAPTPGVVAKKTEAPPAPDESAQLAKSLSFLSSGSTNAKKGSVRYDKAAKKDFINAPALGGGSKDSDALDKMATSNGDTNIKTRSSRVIASDAGFDAPHGKGLNDVQGKVSMTELYSAGGSTEGFSEGTELSLSGPGELSESEIEKALSKYLSRFQFCYEKSLLTDSSLAGNIRLQWEIGTSGHVSSAKVLNSQMKNAGLHSCIIGVLKEIPFPKPKGGSVIAKKTFSFKSSAL